ncbi:nitrite reductase large subunit NirB [Paenibacillus humicola]|uniref:nitrite reductase large subunit NirB n=1 Tax=Paenibacillus humicola TaxID=3110540 RepID=UPI00237A783B|nr:nitrite reductase large subunit NirB [Paenibacillus humicola]
MTKQKLVVVGNGMAGVRCVEEIMKLAPDRFETTIFGGEPHPNYNRILLSKVLQGDTDVREITINDWDWYKTNGIELYAGDPVVRIDTNRRRVIGESGRIVNYDKLIVATGSLPFMLPLPGADKPGVRAFRDIADCTAMMEASKTYRKAAVIGGGLLGLEAARGLLNLGMDVHVVHNVRYLMNRQLDETAAGLLKRELERQGMKFLLAKQTERILGRKRAEGLLFTDGSSIEADLVVVAVGIRPNVRLAAESGMDVHRAIVVNDYMETSVPDVYAVGECAEHRGMVYGMVAPLYEQGKVLAARLCGTATKPYEGSILASQLKVSGVDLFSAGEIRDAEVTTSIQTFDGVKGVYKKITVRDDRIVGAVLYGDTSDSGRLLGYIKRQADVSVLEESGAAAKAGGTDVAAAMPDAETVCACNGVSKGVIAAAIRERGLKTAEEVRACTKASSSCGGCKPLVTAILNYTLSHADAGAAPKETVCGCTGLSHAELKRDIRLGGFASPGEAMAALGWERPEGCAVCRPALSYYIGAAGHAAGSGAGASPSAYSGAAVTLTPRMYGGLTNAEQLRRIADAIDTHGIPRVKLSPGGRLELSGLDAAAAAAVCAAFGLPADEIAGASWGYPAPAVATCAGAGYERSALRDSVRLGGLLERRLAGLRLPAAVSAGVSGSPLHRAGTLAMDLGLAGSPAGWEIYVGGSGGSRLKPGVLLGTEPDDEAALELAAAFLQLYANEADYGETTAHWVERTGLMQLREMLFDRHVRSALLRRLEERRPAPEARGEAGRTAAKPLAAAPAG